MKKTLTKKRINGHDYYYLSYRKGEKVVSQYLGSSSSTKYKKYLYLLFAVKILFHLIIITVRVVLLPAP